MDIRFPILASYELKVQAVKGRPGGFIEEREIAVEDELSTCLWMKLGEGTWGGEDGSFAWPIWLEMPGMNMLTELKKDGDSLILDYQHGGIVQK